MLLSLPAFAQNSPQCPPESFVVDYVSPITKARKSFCGYQKDGVTIKHGEEFIFDTKGNVTKKLSFNHGKEGEAPVSVAPPKEQNLPSGDEQKLLASIHDLMEILTLKKANLGKGMFKVRKCDNKPSDWVKGALFNSPINKSYKFDEFCDVSGSFSANFSSEFPVNFDLRNLQDFNKTNMKVKMSLNKAKGLRYRFEVSDGFISSSSRNANFKVEYEVDLDPGSGNTLAGTQTGKIHLTKIDGKEVSASKDLKFEE